MPVIVPFEASEVKETPCNCMYCGKDCTRTETVYTGDENSYLGWELWCYCEYCKADTFHIIEPVQTPLTTKTKNKL